MAPKKQPSRAVKMVVTTKKVVEETVKVVVGPDGENNEQLDLPSSSTTENQNVDVEPVSRTIPVQEKSTPLQQEMASGDDQDDETQPSSQPETSPTPPPKVTPAQEPAEPVEPVTPREDREKKKRRMAGAGEKNGTEKKRRRRGGGGEGYKRYLWKVMKQVHPEMGISSKAMTVVNNLMGDMFERLADEAARLQGHAGRRTMSSREVQSAVKLVLPGELGKHAIAEGTKAVSNYISYVSRGKEK